MRTVTLFFSDKYAGSVTNLLVNRRYTVVLLFLLLASGLAACSSVRVDQTGQTWIEFTVPGEERAPELPLVHHQEAEYLSVAELVSLVHTPHPTGALGDKLARFFRTPLVSNNAFLTGHRTLVSSNTRLGRFIRVATWNIEKSIRIHDAVRALGSEPAYSDLIDTTRAPVGSRTYKTMLRQRERLASADIIILQEMDIGVSRSGYVNAVEELAQVLDMNYAYAPQYLEIDPLLLGVAELKGETANQRHSPRVDPERYKGVFGSGIISRYPIKRARVFPLRTQPYDWYADELGRFGPLEASRRTGARVAFHSEITRELKVGGRHFFQIDLHLPGLPHDTLSIINIHLEIKCEPKGREAQLREILSYIGSIQNPVIMAGDFNSAPTDISAVTAVKLVQKQLYKPSTWTSFVISLTTGIGAWINGAKFVLNTAKNFHSPLAWDISLLLPNPVKPLFNRIQRFRFQDGGAFDFRGDTSRSINGRRAILSNSNHKAVKGQMTTFSVRRPLGPVGLYRLDWIFVKAFLTDPFDTNGPYRFAPHFGETLVEFNKFLTAPISDHRPNIVDLPLDEPPQLS